MVVGGGDGFPLEQFSLVEAAEQLGGDEGAAAEELRRLRQRCGLRPKPLDARLKRELVARAVRLELLHQRIRTAPAPLPAAPPATRSAPSSQEIRQTRSRPTDPVGFEKQALDALEGQVLTREERQHLAELVGIQRALAVRVEDGEAVRSSGSVPARRVRGR